MIIDLKNLKLLPFALSVVVIVQASVSFVVYPMLRPLSYLCLAIVIFGFFTMTCIKLRHPQFSIFDLLVFAFYSFFILFSLIKHTDFKDAIYISFAIWLVLLLFSYYRNNIKLIVQSFAFAFSCCIYANSLLPAIFPDIIFSADNVFSSFLLGGNHNQMGARMITGIATSLLCTNYDRRWLINSVLLIVISITTLGVVGSMTSLAAIVFFTFLFLIPSRQLKTLAAIVFLVFIILFQVFIVFSGEGLHNNELAVFIIEDLLGKDMSFTGRTIQWDAAARLLVNSPIIGYGFVDNDWYIANMSTFAIGPHNFIYSILVYGGITLLLMFIILAAMGLRKLLHNPDNTALMLFMAIDTLLTMSLMETYPLFFIFFLLILAYQYPHIKDSWQQQVTEEVQQETEEA